MQMQNGNAESNFVAAAVGMTEDGILVACVLPPAFTANTAQYT